MYRLDLSTNVWSEVRVDPQILPNQMMSMLYRDGTVYIIGGKGEEPQSQYDDGLFKVISTYNTSTDKWTYKVKSLPTALCGCSCAFMNDDIYVVGGLSSAGFNDCIYRIDMKNMKSTQVMMNKITKLTKGADGVHQIVSSSCDLTSDGQEIIVFGGSTYESEVNTIFNINLKKYRELEDDVTANIVI